MIIINKFFFYLLFFILLIDIFFLKNDFSDLLFLIFINIGYFLFLTKLFVHIGRNLKLEKNIYGEFFFFFIETTFIIFLIFVKILYIYMPMFCFEKFVIFFLGIIAFFFAFASIDLETESFRRLTVIVTLIIYYIFIDILPQERIFLIVMGFIYFGFILKYIYHTIFQIFIEKSMFSFRKNIITVFLDFCFILFERLYFFKYRTFYLKYLYTPVLLWLPFFSLKFFLNQTIATVYIVILLHTISFIIIVYNRLISDVDTLIFLAKFNKDGENFFEKLLLILADERDLNVRKIGVLTVIAGYENFKAVDSVTARMLLNKDRHYIFFSKKYSGFLENSSCYYNKLLMVTPGIINIIIVNLIY